MHRYIYLNLDMSHLMRKQTMWFPTRSDIKKAVQAQKMARGWKFWIWNCTIPVAKTKALISFAVIAKLICAFVYAYTQRLFSHVATHILILDRTANSCV